MTKSPIIIECPLSSHDIFIINCTETMHELEKYKLKANLMDCNISKEEVTKYYDHFIKKSSNRLDFLYQRLQDLIRSYYKNVHMLAALELKAVNNMLGVFNRRMGEQGANFLSERLGQEEIELGEIIIGGGTLGTLERIRDRVRDETAKLQGGKKGGSVLGVMIIGKAEIQYADKYQGFQIAMANTINQFHNNLQKLADFYTQWQNLGSSEIYELKTMRQIIIDKNIDKRKAKSFLHVKDTQQSLQNMCLTLPQGHPLHSHYQQKLQQFRSHSFARFQHKSGNKVSLPPGKRNLKGGRGISKVGWYQCEGDDIREGGHEWRMLQEKEDGYFRYTYEELTKETREYMDQFKNEALSGANVGDNYGDRFFIFCQKRKSRLQRQQQRITDISTKQSSSLQMSTDCWMDRQGCKGFFNVGDFPQNLFQRRIQYQNDRQKEMENMDLIRSKEYIVKESKLELVDDQSGFNIGFKNLDPNVQLQQIREFFSKQYSLDYLPAPKTRKKSDSDFSDSSSDQNVQQPGKVEKSKEQILNRKSQQNRKLTEQAENLPILTKKQSNKVNQKKIREKYGWMNVKTKQRTILELFTLNYLPAYEKSLVLKAKKKFTTFQEDMVQDLEYIYLQNYDSSEISSCLKQRKQKDNLNKIFFINKQFYAKTEPIFFSNRGKTIKITICLAVEIKDFNQLKKNFEIAFSNFGLCKFQINTEFIEKSISSEERFYGMIGDILKDIYSERLGFVEQKGQNSGSNSGSQKYKTESSSENNSQQKYIKGKKCYESYVEHCKFLKQIQ